MAAPHLYRLPEVIKRTGLSRATIYNAIKEGTFPPPRQIGLRAVAWHEVDLSEWANNLPVANYITEIMD